MANIKSQIKRNRQNEARQVRNKGTRSALKTKIKRFIQTVEAGNRDEAQEQLAGVTRSLDKAAAKGVIHKNKASNQKSRLARKLGS